MSTMTWRAELTDTFGGEANYAWVRRETFTLAHDATDRQIVAAGKAALGLSGTRCRTTNYGDLFECRPVGTCTVAFIQPDIPED